MRGSAGRVLRGRLAGIIGSTAMLFHRYSCEGIRAAIWVLFGARDRSDARVLRFLGCCVFASGVLGEFL